MNRGSNPEALVLRLALRNFSENVVFTPMDPYFVRRWSEGTKAPKPFTCLEMGGQRFFGGPLEWHPLSKHEPRQTIKGQDYDRELKPGQEMTTWICTDPTNIEVLHAFDRGGPCLWRLQIRRGLVPLRDREVSATAVIGVQFDRSEIRMTKEEKEI